MDHRTEREILSNLSEVAFLRECDHPNIVKFISAYKTNKELWVTMELMEGGTLSDAIKLFDFKEPHVAYVAQEMLAALKYLHERQFVHRDLKSKNVMMTTEGTIKLSNACLDSRSSFAVDFGLCTDVSSGPKQSMLGSPFWMPPEVKVILS